MELLKDTEMLCAPTKTPRGWYVLYQGDYNTPNVFNFHEKGLFKSRPHVAADPGARLLVNEQTMVAVQYMHLVDSVTIHESTGEKYLARLERGLFPLTDDLKLEKRKLTKIVPEKTVREEIIRVYDEWISSLSGSKGREINLSEVKKSLSPAVERGRKFYQEWLVKNNSPWITPFLPRMIHDFRHGIYERVRDELYNYYREIGGETPEKDLVKKINLFSRLYEGDGLTKPGDALWTDEDEIWDCWVAFSGSETEAKRICDTMETVLIPLKEELRKELGIVA